MIGNDTNFFQGTFIGNGHSIYADINYPNTQFVGLFNRIEGGGGVYSLTVVGNVRGDNNVGGIVGIFNGNQGNGQIINCINNANIYGGDTIGGIAGIIYGGGDFSNLKNAGTIQSINEKEEPFGEPGLNQSIIGGIAGYVEGPYSSGL